MLNESYQVIRAVSYLTDCSEFPEFPYLEKPNWKSNIDRSYKRHQTEVTCKIANRTCSDINGTRISLSDDNVIWFEII